MKIKIIDVDPRFLKENRKAYVFHSPGYTMEGSFLSFIRSIATTEEADWYYLPILWTHWHLDHNYAKEGLAELQEEVNKVLKYPEKTFTICQYDDGPQVDIGGTVLFSGAKRRDIGITIPMLVLPHDEPEDNPEKKYLASFTGNYKTDPIRIKMAEQLKDREDVLIVHSKKDKEGFIMRILESYATLCPRGSAIGSFRFYESMQLGTVPIAIGDVDPRPFGKWIDWDSCSFYEPNVENIGNLLDSLDKEKLIEMGKNARKIWWECLYNKAWCNYVLKELEWIQKTR
jgi:hypothetical protein